MEKHALNMCEAWVPTPVPKQKNKCNLNDRKKLMVFKLSVPHPMAPRAESENTEAQEGSQTTF